MVRSTSQFEGATTVATDGEAGSVNDLLFDDEQWTVRYIVVKSGGWLNSREILMSPISVTGVDWANRTFAVDLTREQIRSGPDNDTDKPVSRQHEIAVPLREKGDPHLRSSKEARDPADLGPGMVLGGLYRAENDPPF